MVQGGGDIGGGRGIMSVGKCRGVVKEGFDTEAAS